MTHDPLWVFVVTYVAWLTGNTAKHVNLPRMYYYEALLFATVFCLVTWWSKP